MRSMDIQPGAMLIREGLLLPDSARLESRSYSKPTIADGSWQTMIYSDFRNTKIKCGGYVHKRTDGFLRMIVGEELRNSGNCFAVQLTLSCDVHHGEAHRGCL